MTDSYVYTVITFAPVQGFIEKSRKLRDLYGSSFLLSYLSWIICTIAKSKGFYVVSPAQTNVIQGTPNQIIIKGDFKKTEAEAAFKKAWKCITESCREWIDDCELRDDFNFCWKRTWDLWTVNAWEFFWVQGKPGETISQVRQKLNDKKYARAWTGINWQGESSTLSGADAIAHPGLGRISDPRAYNYQQEKTAIQDFYNKLSERLGNSFIKITGLKVPDSERSIRSQEYGESFINPREELSIPELIKRLITHQAVADKIVERFKKEFSNNQEIFAGVKTQIEDLYKDLRPDSFKDISRFKTKKLNDKLQIEQQKFPQGWFQGDGDKAGDLLKTFAKCRETEASNITEFSTQMRAWGKDFYENPPDDCRIVYAGGDDFLGVFYQTDEKQKLEPKRCVDWFSQFKSEVWQKDKKKPIPITVSVGFVWAPPDIPQRDVLQHCREAEKSAKSNGRDRIAFRVLFNNGNYVEWVCPWWLLEQGLLSNYCDRSENKSVPNWTHIYNDVAVLESRHAFTEHNVNIAYGLLDIYFPTHKLSTKTDATKLDNNKSWHQHENENIWWNHSDSNNKFVGGILGDKKSYYKEDTETIDGAKVNQALNNWVINLAKVGFYLCQQEPQKKGL